MADPQAGDVIRERAACARCALPSPPPKGHTRRFAIIYYYWSEDGQIWLFTIYNKDEADDLTPDQARLLKARLDHHIMAGSLI